MKPYPGIDYQQRPLTYEVSNGGLACLLDSVKGTARRDLIERCWHEGTLEALPEELLQGSLTGEDREEWGRIHPLFMGGEFLPDCRRGEIEIARLELRSTTGDVIGIRARKRSGPFRYRIVDEYHTAFAPVRQSSRAPLSLHELVRFIDGSRHPDWACSLALCYNEMNSGGGDRESLKDFTTVRSLLYPQLEEHYRQVFADWARGEA